MLRTSISLLACVLLAACAGGAPAPKPETTYDKIRAELATGAAQRPAAPPEAVSAALLPPVKLDLPKARAPLEERFSVSFNNVPAQQFFMSIVTGTRYNMLISPEVSGNITLNLKDVTLHEVLDAARDLYGYEYRIDGTRITVLPLTLQTRLFQINYLTATRKSASDIRVSSSAVGNAVAGRSGGAAGQQRGGDTDPGNGNQVAQVDSSRISTASANDFWAELRLALDAIVGKGEGRSIVVSPQSGVVVIKAMPDELRNVTAYLKATQLSVDRQVILEAKILEVELNDNFQSGINWASFASFHAGRANRVSGGLVQPGTTLRPLPADGSQPAASAAGDLAAIAGYALGNTASAGAGSLFGLAFQTSNFAALLSFLESQGTVHVLSSPRIAAMNNQPAVLKIGSDEFYVTGVSTSTTSGTNGTNVTTPSLTLQPFFSGVVLDVTPQIDERGNITFHVHPSVSQVTTVNKAINLGNIGNYNLPLAASSTSEADTVVRGRDGHIVALGGMMREASTGDRSQVPGADKVPVLGKALGNTARSMQKRELVILIKPTIVHDTNDWAQDISASGRRIETLDTRGRR